VAVVLLATQVFAQWPYWRYWR